MKLLIIDTAHHPGRLWLVEGENVVMAREWDNGQKTGILLLEALESALGESGWELPEIERIGVQAGPGGYSSLRAGVVSGEMLGVASEVPVVPVSGEEVEGMIEQVASGDLVEVVEMRYQEG